MPTILRKVITSRIGLVLSKPGLELAECGGKYDDLRQEVSNQTGFWADKSYDTKPSRLIVHLDITGKEMVARMPDPAEWHGNFAYANTAGHRKVGGLIVRVLPVFKLGEGNYEPYPSWEWLLWYCFWPKLAVGHSGTLFSHFNAANGTFTYNSEPQSYIAAGLVTLNLAADEYIGPNGIVTYNAATEAISKLVHVAPTVPTTINANG
jgi:hypothetical protein